MSTHRNIWIWAEIKSLRLKCDFKFNKHEKFPPCVPNATYFPAFIPNAKYFPSCIPNATYFAFTAAATITLSENS